RVDLSHLGPGARAVVARIIHASADTDYAHTTVVDEAAVRAGASALRAGAPVLTDVEMVRQGISGVETVCCLDEIPARPATGATRSAMGIALAARRHPSGAVVAVGCAPTALLEVVRLVAEEGFAPALVVGMPVGFVGAAEAKAATRQSGLPAITNVGEKGGSAVTAAAVNAIIRLSQL
ncbi:MAG TPA: precorrin-8X methylmutase, partial [Acidimicrobiales bacterium]|nr:precorrin-8X methylmutase [Acidimicrobiales bacterium]